MELKRAIKAIGNLQQIFKHILCVFELCPEIKQVMLILGGTTISPKESYLINLPPSNPEADNLSLKSSTRTLFRQLIMQDILGGRKSISPTSLTILVNAPRTMEMLWFLPKSAFKMPIRGEKYIIDLIDHCACAPNEHSMMGDHVIDVSGVEPLESSAIDMSFVEKARCLLDATDISGSSCPSEEEGSTLTLLKPFTSSDLSSQTSFSSEASSAKKLLPLDDDIWLSKSACKKIRTSSACSGETRESFSDGQPKCDTNGCDTYSPVSEFMWFQAPIKFKGYRSKRI